MSEKREGRLRARNAAGVQPEVTSKTVRSMSRDMESFKPISLQRDLSRGGDQACRFDHCRKGLKQGFPRTLTSLESEIHPVGHRREGGDLSGTDGGFGIPEPGVLSGLIAISWSTTGGGTTALGIGTVSGSFCMPGSIRDGGTVVDGC